MFYLNPNEHLKRLIVKADRRHDRWALTPDECQKLLVATATGPVRWNMSAHDRVRLSRTALGSGLRARELKTLTVGNCHLDSYPPVLIVKAAYSKHRCEDVQPIPDPLARVLRDYLADRSANELVFKTMPPIGSVAKMLRKDLEAAGMPYQDDTGRFADFHALRHTYITNLARAGIHPKTAMDLARHSDINLTMARYSHTVVSDRGNALAALSKMTDDKDEPQQLRATGTYDSQPEKAISEPEPTSTTTSDTIGRHNSRRDDNLHEVENGLRNRRLRVRVAPGAL